MRKGTKGIRKVFTGQKEYYVFDLDEDAFGKRKRLYANTEGELKEKIEAAQQERKAVLSAYKPKSNLLSDYVRFYFKNAIGTIAARDIKRLLTLFENAVFSKTIDKEITLITEQEVQEFYNALIEKFPRKRIEEIDDVLKKVFTISNEEGLTNIDLKDVVIPEERERVIANYILEPNEFENMLSFCINDNCTRYGRNEQLIIMCMLTGLKFSSLKKLTVKDVDLIEGSLMSEGKKYFLSVRCIEWLTTQSKNGSLPILSPEIEQEMREEGTSKCSYDEDAILFINSNNASPTLQSVQSTVVSITNICGLPKGITGKTLCKSFMVSEIKNGATIEEVCEKLHYKNKTALANILDEYEVRKALF